MGHRVSLQNGAKKNSNAQRLGHRMQLEYAKHGNGSKAMTVYPIGSMYGIYANIGGILMVNVIIYSIHGSYGYIIILPCIAFR